MTNKKITILLATYKGAEYIAEQLDSLLNQTYSNWELIIHDDGSPDETLDIISAYAKTDNRVKILLDTNKHLGACQNFSHLMSANIEGDYVMFCDQDDIWESDKIEKSLNAILSLELTHGINEPLMVYGTYRMINQEGGILYLDSPDYSVKPNLRLLLSQNYIYGCTMIINRRLLTLSSSIPNTAENHDYWICLVALMNNAHIGYIIEPMILYRQHSNNVSGSYTNASFLNRIKRILNDSEVVSIKSRLKMFRSLNERFEGESSHKKLLSSYIENVSKGGWAALLFCVKNGISRRGKLQSILFYFNLWRTPKSIELL
ncbi:glycosyltransferase family 2 protein [Pedobacter gandavensis]|uniref:glycosyltransferase family 2 protein n=1 Tax=Pedobacter gandavensis TaxID=2679963 RepID=UPI002478EE91|nr:glycosyltransferase family 2 protein [Pedobacter gandavensis]WGQ07514.1 glycosyltransferase family 2 protein [Pedobacter gandavensis]